MSSVTNANVNSLDANRNPNASQASLQRLASGRTNSAQDDAAGQPIPQRFTAQINGSDQTARNANDGISLAQTAEGALAATTDNLQRIRRHAVQAVATGSPADRNALQIEVGRLLSEIDRVGNNATFNGVKLLDGSDASFVFQVGANTSSHETITVSGLPTATKAGLGIALLDVSCASGAQLAIRQIDSAIDRVDGARAALGAVQTRFTSVVTSQATNENLSASHSRIRDADFAAETANRTRAQILQQADTAILAQANSVPNNVLTLLKG